jgi:hypothetical protein
MNVLLLHPEDNLPSGESVRTWDLIVDFGRASASTYECWSRQTACPLISIYDFSKGTDDLRLCRELLKPGMGCLFDHYGIDWWDVLSFGIVPELLQFILLGRLAEYIDASCELYATRPFWPATALQNQLSCTLKVLGGTFDSIRRQFRHYAGVLSNLDAAQLSQVMQDKFDRRHAIRCRLSRQGSKLNTPVILLPSAYVNVSRMAVRYAELLPEQDFLLVLARRSGKLQSLPSNVSAAYLDPYFGSSNHEQAHLFDKWGVLRQRLVRDEGIFKVAAHAGILKSIGSSLQWGLSIRDAWTNVFNTQPIAGCLCADDTNPYTRIPLLLAKNRGMPAIACHHGALDCWMSVKTPAADFYLAKSEMERDYLIHTCEVPHEQVVLCGPDGARATTSKAETARSVRSCIVFFTEPYEATGWRSEEVYKDLLPRLCSLAQSCGLKLVFKLHPFESIKDHRKKLRRVLGDQGRKIEVIAGPPTSDLWQNMKLALSVESSTAVECAARGIPVFLCTWLRDSYSGYAQQYAKFGVGCALESPEQIADIPQLLRTRNWSTVTREETIHPETLQDLFSQTTACELPMNRRTFASCADSQIAS